MIKGYQLVISGLFISLLMLSSCSDESSEEAEQKRFEEEYLLKVSLKGKGREYIRNYMVNTFEVEKLCEKALSYIPEPTYKGNFEFGELKRLKWDWFGDQIHELNYEHTKGFESVEFPGEQVEYSCHTDHTSDWVIHLSAEFDYWSSCDRHSGWIDFSYYLEDKKWLMDEPNRYRNLFSEVCRGDN